ncbi:MAG: protein kinase [Oscillospiraceae bacterium]|nr:protein kinase [Oscillospiraceae bacterium]
MIEINGRQFCENCFESVTGAVCASCGFDSSDSAPDPSMLVPGSVLQNRYVIGRVIGKGGFGITYLAYDALVCKKIAVKEYFPYGLAHRAIGSADVSVASADSAEAFRLGAEKFYNEAKLVAKFNGNPNIVSVYDCFYENGTVYIAMEYLSGRTLKEYIREQGVLSAPKALFVAKNIAGALVVAHSASVLHRDISPDNIILCNNGNIKLIDFGAARQVVAEHSQSFSVIIKPGFAPPEQYRKKGNQGPWTDVYSLGTTLYFTLTGDIPDDPSARVDDDDTFKENLFDIDPGLWKIITKATKLKIEERYADAYELKKALDLVDIGTEPLIVSDGSSDDSAEPAFASSGNVTDMTVSIKTLRPKQSFWRRHRRTLIEIVCGVLVAAIIIPLAIKAYKPIADITPDTGGSSSATGDDASTSGGSGAITTIKNGSDLEKENFTKPMYSCLNGDAKALYEYIFVGVRANEKNIVLPSLTYKVGDIDKIFNFVLNENPALNDTQGYNLNYNDLNSNKEPDPDEYVISISPIYTGIDRMVANDYIVQSIHDTVRYDDPTTRIKLLCDIHDMILKETEHVARNSGPAASSTHGVLIDHAADDLGVARTLCDYAQRMGFDSFVVETDREEDYSAIVRIKIDDQWYNIDTFTDGLMPSGAVHEIPLTEDGKITHFWFLHSDVWFKAGAFEILGDFGEEYSSIIPFYDETLEDPEVTNYYIDDYLNKELYFGLDDSVYNSILEDTKKWFDSQDGSFEIYLMYDYVDEFWKVLQESYISDLSEKYGITVSGFTGEYTGDAIRITFET